MAEALPLIKKQLSIESDKVNKQINIKADSIITLIDLLKKKEAVDEEAKDMLTNIKSTQQLLRSSNSTLVFIPRYPTKLKSRRKQIS